MAEMGNSQSEISCETTAPTNSGTNDAPGADGSGDKVAQPPTSPAEETVKPSADSCTILSAAGEPLNIGMVIAGVAQSTPESKTVNDNEVVHATPPAAPISGDKEPLLPCIQDPIIIQSPVSTTLPADLINNSIIFASASDAPIDAGTPESTLTNDVTNDAALQKATTLPDASAPIVTAPVITPLPVNPETVVTDPPGTVAAPVASIPELGTPSGLIAFTSQTAPSDSVVPILTEVAISVATLANDVIPTLGEGVHADSSANAKDNEIELLKARVKTLETELTAALTRPGTRNHELVETIKQQHEELLKKASGMIFDKTKIVKNQELQIAALTAQVASLKDVNSITKDLLEIRNSEIKHLEERMECMEGRFKAEKERHMLVLKRAETGQSINNDLKSEYETQLKLFKELREKYDQRVQALVAENKRLSEASGGPAPSPST